MTVLVLHNQSPLDMAIQHTGSVENVFDFCLQNNQCITDVLLPGSLLDVPDNMSKDQIIVAYYQDKKLQPATGGSEPVRRALAIGDMQVESTFIIL